MARRLGAGLAASLLLAAPGAAMAAGQQCVMPRMTPVPKASGPSEAQPRRVVPSSLYMLAVSWAPQYCASGEGLGGDFARGMMCEGQQNRFGFILHGLWPDGDGKSWPQYCRATKLLRPAVIRANLCLTPSADLLQHEWAKHGTCEWRTAELYFADARRLYERLRFPDMDALVRREGLSVAAFTEAFVDANPGLPEAAVQVALSGEGWLQEVRLCMDPRYRYVTCPGLPADGARTMTIRPIGPGG